MIDPTRRAAAPPLLLEVDVTMPDIEAFNLHVGFSPRMRARARRQLIVIYVLAMVAVVGWNWIAFGAARFDWYAHLAVPVVAMAVFMLALTPLFNALQRWTLRRGLRALLGRAPRENYLGRKRIEVTAEGIAVIGSTSQGFYGWAAVTGLQETPDLILVMLGEAMAIVVPKRDQPEPVLDTLRAAVRDAGGIAA